VITDNRSDYCPRRFVSGLHRLVIRHISSRPYSPKANGKAERFILTILRKWANGVHHPT
jgi:transposase InsO family protein